MATVTAVIIEHQKKKDGSWNVKVRLNHKTDSVYIPTDHFVTKSQINKKFEIKDTDLWDDYLHKLLARYRKSIAAIGDQLEDMTAKEVKERVLNSSKKVEVIDFIAFSRDKIKDMINAGRESSAKTLMTVVNSLVDYRKSESLYIDEITSSFLVAYEKYLKSERIFYRNNFDGKALEYKRPPLSDAGLHNHMRDLRLLFNAARNYYNDEDRGIIRIKHYPFKKYIIKNPPETEKRGLSIENIKAIRDYKAAPGSRSELARDLFMLSFYLCGMNAVDMYKLTSSDVNRVDYNRAKTSSRRKDRAFFSVDLPDVAVPIYKKYAGKLQDRYSTSIGLSRALDKGISVIIESVGFQFDFYSARHSFGDLARNKLRFSKDDVGLALNHKDRSTSTTDIYISKDWTIVDEVQEKVIALLFV